MLKRLKAQGITILVSTPYMDEAALCDRVGLIQNGKILAVDSPSNITAGFPDVIYALKSEDTKSLLKDAREFNGIISCEPFGEYNHVVCKKDGFNETSFMEYLRSKNHSGLQFEKIEPSIEDCFIYLMNQN